MTAGISPSLATGRRGRWWTCGRRATAWTRSRRRRIHPNIEALLQQPQLIEQLVEVLGMGTVTRREMPARLHTLRRLLTLPKGVREVISEMSAVNLELLCTGTDVDKRRGA